LEDQQNESFRQELLGKINKQLFSKSQNVLVTAQKENINH
jgi:hypothetical protein